MELLTEYTAQQLVRDQMTRSQHHQRRRGHLRTARSLRKVANRINTKR
jgi:hypothetical protein